MHFTAMQGCINSIIPQNQKKLGNEIQGKKEEKGGKKKRGKEKKEGKKKKREE